MTPPSVSLAETASGTAWCCFATGQHTTPELNTTSSLPGNNICDTVSWCGCCGIRVLMSCPMDMDTDQMV